jgi:hypothetical protein
MEKEDTTHWVGRRRRKPRMCSRIGLRKRLFKHGYREPSCDIILTKARAIEHEIPSTTVPEAPEDSRCACDGYHADGDAHFFRCLCEDRVVRGGGVEMRVGER